MRGNVNVLQPRVVSKNHIIIQGFSRKTPVNLLIDTGASISLVNTRLIDQLNAMNEVVPTSSLIAGLGNKIIPVRGEIKLPINFGNMQISHTYVVCDNLEYEYLLGVDLLRKFEIKIDIPGEKIFTPYGEEKFLQKPVSVKNR